MLCGLGKEGMAGEMAASEYTYLFPEVRRRNA